MDTGMNVNVFVQCVNQKEKHDIFAKFDIMTFVHTPITRPGRPSRLYGTDPISR